MPEAERSLVVVLAHALNEINTLNKLLFFSTQFDSEPTWLAHAHGAQAFIVAKPLIGKLNEAWVALEKGYFGTKLSLAYNGLLETSATDALTFLKAYFSRSNAVNTVRNNFAFHYSLDHAKTDIPDDASPDDLATYLHETNGNSLYYFAEYLMSKALMETLSPLNPAGALGNLLDEMSKVIAAFNEFVQGLMYVVLDKHIGAEAFGRTFQDIQLPSAVESADVRIPVFFVVSRPSDGGVA